MVMDSTGGYGYLLLFLLIVALFILAAIWIYGTHKKISFLSGKWEENDKKTLGEKALKRKKSKRTRILVVLSILVLLVLAYKSDTMMFGITEKISDNFYKVFNENNYLRFLKQVNLLSRLEYKLNPFAIKKDLSDGTLPIYDLRFSQNDMAHFKEISEEAKEAGYLTENNTWRDAELKYDGKTYKIKVKLRGDMTNHWVGKLKSYGIKLAQEEDYINNIREFNLFIFEDKLLRSRISDIIANYLGLYDLREELVVVKINGITQGVYYLQEQRNDEFLEYNECSSCQIFAIKDNYFEDHPPSKGYSPYGIFYSAIHDSPFDYEISNINPGGTTEIERKALAQGEKLLEAIRSGNYEDMTLFFDADYVSGVEAMKAILGTGLFMSGDNIELVYKGTDSRFYIVPRNEIINHLVLEKGSFEHNMEWNEMGNDLAQSLTRNNEIRQLRNKKLYKYTTSQDLISQIDEMIEFYSPYISSYESNFHSPRYLKYLMKEDRRNIEENFKIIKEALEYSKLYINTFQQDNVIELEIIPDSLSQLHLTTLTLNLTQPYAGDITITARDLYNPNLTTTTHLTTPTTEINLAEEVSNLYFSATLDENLYPKKEKYTLQITFEEDILLTSVKAEALNDITGKPLQQNDVYVEIADSSSFVKGEDMSFLEFQQEYPEFNFVEGKDAITIPEGRYYLNRDMVFPKKYKIIIEKGTEIFLGKDVAIVSYQPVIAIGTEQEPIIIKAMNPLESFGSFGIIGKYFPSEPTVLEWVDVSGGYEKRINGLYISGAVSIHHMDTILKNVKIHNNNADDGINIKYSKTSISNSIFEDNFADQIDLDFCDGIVEDNLFSIDKRKDSNGDGLDLSGSNIIVENNDFIGLADKGVSIGEKTNVFLINNRMEKNNMGTAVKDSSYAYIFQNQFEANNVSISAYQKKKLYNGGYAYLYENSFSSNNKDYEKDRLSSINELTLTEQEESDIISSSEERDISLLFEYLKKAEKENSEEIKI